MADASAGTGNGNGTKADVSVQVCYAPPTPAEPVMIDLLVAAGTTVAQALACDIVAGTLKTLGVDPADCRVGIWGKLRPLETALRDRDRLELYRPLVADPKEARRRRAQKKPAP